MTHWTSEPMNLIFFASSTLSLRFASCPRPRLSLSIARFSPRRAAGSGVRRPLRRGAVREAERSLAGDAERGGRRCHARYSGRRPTREASVARKGGFGAKASRAHCIRRLRRWLEAITYNAWRAVCIVSEHEPVPSSRETTAPCGSIRNYLVNRKKLDILMAVVNALRVSD